MPADLAVVIVTYNSAHVVGDLLDSLPAALGGLAADVIVVDNGSADLTVEFLAKRADCHLVSSANNAYAAGINRGVSERPAARAILVLNPDVVLRPGPVPPMLTALGAPGV